MDMHLWNLSLFKPPSRNLFETCRDHAHLKVFENILSKWENGSEYRNLLRLEGGVLHRFYTRMRGKYRSEKGFKYIAKVIKSLKILFNMDLNSVMTLCTSKMEYGKTPSTPLTYWILVRFQSYCKLLDRIIKCTKEAERALNYRLKTGHSWLEIFASIAMISRIWCLSNRLLTLVCEIYNELLPSMLTLSSKCRKMPKDLFVWVADDTIENKFIPSITDSNATPEKALLNKSRKKLQINSTNDLKKFILHEKTARCKDKKKSLTLNLDNFQFHMLEKKIGRILKMIKKNEKQNEKQLLLLRRAKKCISQVIA